MKPCILILPAVILSSCAAIRETAIVHAPQDRVREAIAEEIHHKGGMITNDTKFTVVAEHNHSSPIVSALVGPTFEEWIFNLSGSDPTRVVLKPWGVTQHTRVQLPVNNRQAFTAVQQSLYNIKLNAEGNQNHPNRRPQSGGVRLPPPR